jgi:abelson tyrosine-protein kinase 1
MSFIHLVSFCLSKRDANTLTIDNGTVTLPLWSPSTVSIGSVGYLRKPEGDFITLFNAFDPPKSSDGVLKGMANLHGYGNVSEGEYRQDKRNRAQRGLDVIQSWLTSKSDPFVNSLLQCLTCLTGLSRNNINRRYSFSLKANHKIAFLCVESTMYKYIEDLSTPKEWFKANVDEILRSYGDDHSITKEDVFLGMLEIAFDLNRGAHNFFYSYRNTQRAGLRFVRQSRSPRREGT